MPEPSTYLSHKIIEVLNFCQFGYNVFLSDPYIYEEWTQKDDFQFQFQNYPPPFFLDQIVCLCGVDTI